MRRTVRSLVLAILPAAMLLIGLPAVASAQAQKSFVRDDLASDGVRLEETLRKEAGAQTRPAAQLRKDAETALGKGDARRAIEPGRAPPIVTRTALRPVASSW